MFHKTIGPAHGLFALALVAACSPSKVREPAVPAARVAQTAPNNEGAVVESAQRKAQRAWCAYLEALYVRAASDGSPWKHRDECLSHESNASPEMLERTASCSKRALDAFDGDPLTPAYAAEVRRCGVEALDASALGNEEIEPFLSALCRRAEACGDGKYAECREGLASHVSERLGRALGAINQPSRMRLRTCLGVAACSSSMAERLSGCIEPIMDDLLWLPASHDDEHEHEHEKE
jgi:hypothetical protein